MVLQALMGGAFAYANSAYTYNMGRYEFDSGQAQTSSHMLMNFRISQWNLFREDIRDLFTLTTSHMSTYMVVGTLFLGFAVTSVWNGIKDFPMTPPWLMLMWGNCFISSLAYGVMCVWLAMHGSITANSSSVKMLSQLIRPPIPSAEDLRGVRRELSDYEARGLSTFLAPPNFLDWRAAGKNVMERMPGQATPEARPGTRPEANSGTSASSSGPPPRKPEDLPPAPGPPPEASGLSDYLGGPSGGPGRSVTLESHFRLFQREQATFLSFDAYARVCLAGSVSQLLLSLSYYVSSYVLRRADAPIEVRWSGNTLAWSGTCLLVFTLLSLFKLDLYVERHTIRFVKGLIVMGPLAASLALQMWLRAASMLAVWLLVVLAALLHIAWLAFFLIEAAPTGPYKLPTSFRSVRYLDVFGVATHAEEPQSGDARVPEGEVSPQVRALEEVVKVMLREEFASEHLSKVEVEQLQELLPLFPDRQAETMKGSPSAAQWWLGREHGADCGRTMPYFVNPWTLEVLWQAPEDARIRGMAEVLAEAEELRGWKSGQPSRIQPQEQRPARHPLELTESPRSASGATSTGGGASTRGAAQRRPGSSHDQASMPWKYFMQLTICMMLMWVGVLIYCVIDREALLEPRIPTSAAKRVELKWPHEFFAPTALACAGGKLFLGDRFEIFAATLPLAPPTDGAPWPLALQLVLRAEDFPAPWEAMAALKGGEALLLLEKGGQAAFELSLSAPGEARRWLFGASLDTPLRSLAYAESHSGKLCNQSRPAEVNWGLLAATASGEVIGICPRAGRLEPRRRLARPLPPPVEEQLAVHLDAGGRLWHATAGQSGTALRSSHARAPRPLPVGRHWARGVCELAAGGFIFAGEGEGPELWYMPAAPGDGAGRAGADADLVSKRGSGIEAKFKAVV